MGGCVHLHALVLKSAWVGSKHSRAVACLGGSLSIRMYSIVCMGGSQALECGGVPVWVLIIRIYGIVCMGGSQAFECGGVLGRIYFMISSSARLLVVVSTKYISSSEFADHSNRSSTNSEPTSVRYSATPPMMTMMMMTMMTTTTMMMTLCMDIVTSNHIKLVRAYPAYVIIMSQRITFHHGPPTVHCRIIIIFIVAR